MSPRRRPFRNTAALVVLIWSIAGFWQVHAAPTILSVSPPDGASGVSTTTPVVFTFSEAMDTNVDTTSVTFIDITSPLTPILTSSAWTSGDTVLTCTPLPSFPANKTIYWFVDGQNPAGDPLQGTNTLGSFNTTPGVGTGNGTNAITTFSIGKVYHYNQTSAGLPTLDPTTPYDFSGVTSLSSNRTATNINLTFPTAAVSNLTVIPQQPWLYILYGSDVDLNAYNATYPAGDYGFQVRSATSNQTVVVTLPSSNSMPQPGAPHVTNFVAAQIVDPTQPFVLRWDAFPGGTSGDYIDVDVGTFGSPNPGQPGALSGTATSFTIPAGTLQTNTTYSSRIGFFRHVGSTNASYAVDAYRATYTEFSVITIGGASLVLTNAAYVPGGFSFDVLCSPGQNVIVEYQTNLASSIWQTLLTTNSPGDRFHAIAPQTATNRFLFFRARNGP